MNEKNQESFNLQDILDGVAQYIKQYTRVLNEGRLSHLPSQLSKILNTHRCRTNPGKVLAKGAECFVVYGTRPGPRALVNAIGICLTGSLDWGEVILNFGAERLKESPELFKLLENGNLEKKYGDYGTYLSKIQDQEESVTENEIFDLIKLAIPNLNIILFVEDPEIPEKFLFHFQYDSTKFKRDLERTENYNIIIIKRAISFSYNPVFLVKNLQKKKRQTNITTSPPPGLTSGIEAPLATSAGGSRVTSIDSDLSSLGYSRENQDLYKIMVARVDNGVYAMEKIFNLDEHVESMDKILRLAEFTRIISNQERSEYLDKFNMLKIFNLVTLSKELMKEFEVTAQIENHFGYISGVQIKEGVIFPINLSQSRKVGKQYKIIQDFETPLPSLDVLRKVLDTLERSEKIYSEIRDGYKINKVIINMKGQIIGFEGFFGFRFFIEPTEMRKAYKDLPIITLDYYPWDVNQAIIKESQIDDARSRNIKYINYEMEIYHLVRLEIAEEINSEKNIEMRKKITKIWKNEKREEIRKFLAQVKKMVSKNDYVKIKTLVKLNRKEDFANLSFDFDFTVRKKIAELIAMSESGPLKKELGKLIRNRIIFSTKIIQEGPGIKNIRDTCNTIRNNLGETNSYCIWDPKKKKMVLGLDSEKHLSELLDRIVAEVINNDTKRFELLYNKIQRVGDPEIFIVRGNEIIITDNIGFSGIDNR